MGLFSSIGNAASSVVGGAGKTFGLIGEGLGFGPDRSPGAFIPEVDPRLQNISTQQTSQAQNFRSNLPTYTQDKYNIASDMAKQKLGQDMNAIRSGASSRGLLYSGLREGREAQAQGAMVSNLARQRTDINRDAENEARGMEMGAINSGMSLQQANQARQDAIYNAALDKYMNRKSPGQAIGGILGSVGGMAAGGAFSGGGGPSAAGGA
jgi:hypothetical protein